MSPSATRLLSNFLRPKFSIPVPNPSAFQALTGPAGPLLDGDGLPKESCFIFACLCGVGERNSKEASTAVFNLGSAISNGVALFPLALVSSSLKWGE